MKSVIAITLVLVLLIPLTIHAQSQSDIPAWVKNNAVWWGEDKISDSEFISALQYLINNGHLKAVSSSSDTSILQKKVNNLETKILNLNDEISDLETENKRLWKLLDEPQPSSPHNAQSNIEKTGSSSEAEYGKYACEGGSQT